MTLQDFLDWLSEYSPLIQTLGVIATAMATAALAIITRRYSRMTKDLLEDSRLAEKAKLEPVVLPIAPEVEWWIGDHKSALVTDTQQSRTAKVWTTVRNVGQGPAYAIEVTVEIEGVDPPLRTTRVWREKPLIPEIVAPSGVGPPTLVRSLESGPDGIVQFAMRRDGGNKEPGTEVHLAALQKRGAVFQLTCAYSTPLNKSREHAIRVRLDDHGQPEVVEKATPPRFPA